MRTKLLFVAALLASTTLSTPAAAGPGLERQYIPVAIESTGEPFDVYVQPLYGSPKFLCRAPCDTRLEADFYKFALAPKDGERTWLESTFEINQPSTLRGSIETHKYDHSNRVPGWLLLLGGASVTAVMAYAWYEQPKFESLGPGAVCELYCEKRTDNTGYIAGVVLGSIATVIGIVLIAKSKSDETVATLSILPFVPPIASGERGTWRNALSREPGFGVSVSAF